MGKINVLSFELANLIAAGEVVERPSSVLKELIENSIDAGATSIVAEIKRGGVSLIRVTDNGSGIDKEDLPVALRRHATSKIRDREDLDGIMTLGFRGEALAAISSVSRMTIITKTEGSETGHMLTAEAGVVSELCEVGSSKGTTVVVEDLFYNVPARRKFLKKDATEASNVCALVERVALSRPEISIQLLVDGEQRFKTPGDDNLENTVYAVLGKEFSSKLIKADGLANGIHVHGLIGRSDNVRKNRNLQNVFINGRYVKSLTAMAAIEKAYTSYIAPEAFPCCVLFIDMPEYLVDVNVHPAKLEVKFADERDVFEAVYHTVKDALTKHTYRPELTLKNDKGFYNPAAAFVPIGDKGEGTQLAFKSEPTASDRSTYTPKAAFSTSNDTNESRPQKSFSLASGTFPREEERIIPKSTPIASQTFTPRESLGVLESFNKAKAQAIIVPEQENKSYKIVGEAFDCYIIVEEEGELLVIDKHAAHERVIFEDLKKNYENDGRIGSQSLLLPITVMLTPDELSAALSYQSDFEAVGFSFIQNGMAVDITAIPDAISAPEAERLFEEMADGIVKGVGTPENTESLRREKALYQVACKAAIKGGRVYTAAVREWLVAKLFDLPDVIVCPHGRPVAFKLKKSELDRHFDRIK